MWTMPDSVETVAAPVDTLLALDAAANRLGLDATSLPSGLESAVSQVETLVDGIEGLVGYCFRRQSIRLLLYSWPLSSVRLPGGSATSVTIRIGGQTDAQAMSVTPRFRNRIPYLTIKEQLAGWLEGTSVLRIDYVAGPGDANAMTAAQNAAMDLLASLWADRLDPVAGRMAAARKSAKAALSHWNVKVSW